METDKENNGFNVAYDLSGKRVFVAGHRGMVGSAIVRRLETLDCDIIMLSRDKVDLRNQAGVRAWFERERPDAVFLAAAKVGGIFANELYPAEFIHDNLVIQTNVIDAAYRTDCEKLLFLGSSCIYPKFAEQPITENCLLTGPLEPTNQWYAIAKIAGLKMCEAYRVQYGVNYVSAMPTNLYGQGDNFNLENSHVIPALMRKAHEAKIAGQSSIEIWGTGLAKREFLHVDDAADAMVHLMQNYSGAQHVNVGSGEDLSILELTAIICRVVGFDGEIKTDDNKPDGAPRKLMDVSTLRNTGWIPSLALEDGLAQTYAWFLANSDDVARRS